MPIRPPLSLAAIQEIAAKRATNPDIDALLWEVERLQMKLWNTYTDLHEDRNMSRGEIRRLRKYIESEPSIRERIAGQPSLF